MKSIGWVVRITALAGAVALAISAASAQAAPAPDAPSVVDTSSVSALANLRAVPAVKACSDLLASDFTTIEDAPARLSSATVVTDGASQPYCDVKGYTPGAVNFEVRLPISGWTQRFLMLGCGGYCGGVSVTPPASATNGCAPVTSGEMVTASTDLGHTRSATLFSDGLWALGNPDAVADFAYLGMHKTTLVARALINDFYRQAPKYSYYVGCSDGGREGLQEVQRYPADYDALVIGAPTIDEIATNTFYHAWNVRVNTRADGRPILTADKIPALHQAVLTACGTLAGGQGDMLQDPRACNLDARTLICPGADAPSCLTSAQADVANKLWYGPVDADGNRLSPGDMPYGSELAWVGSMVPTDANAVMSPATASDAAWSLDFPNYMSSFSGPTGITYRNMEFTKASFRKLHELTGIYDPTDPGINEFARRGGKLLMWTGAADSGVSPLIALNYYNAVRERLGKDKADQFMTFYLVPGVYHCGGGPTPAQADYLTPLMQWNESKARPDTVVVNYLTSATDPTVAKSRPVYPYPNIARYTGSGSPDDAANYVEALPVQIFNDWTDWLGLSHYRPAHTQWYVGSATLSSTRPAGQ